MTIIMDAIDIAWFAGIFEGEGTIYLNDRGGKSKPSPIMRVRMCDEDIINRIQQVTGVGTVIKETNLTVNRKTIYVWQTGNKRNIARLLLAIAPLLGDRRKNRILELSDHLQYKKKRS